MRTDIKVISPAGRRFGSGAQLKRKVLLFDHYISGGPISRTRYFALDVEEANGFVAMRYAGAISSWLVIVTSMSLIRPS